MIPVNQPVFAGNEKQYLLECIDSGWISSEGPFVKKLEDEFAVLVGRKYGIAVCNGSVALELALAALQIGPGDEVIMPTFTIISCAAAVVRAGAVPVVVDCQADTWNMDPGVIEARITPRTKAIMAVHIYGLPVDMNPVLEIASQYKLKIIEDGAEQIGQMYKGRTVGSFGDLSTVSFYPNKHITTGEGGMVLTDDEALAGRCRALRNLCFDNERRFIHEELGWNFRMSNLQAAVGVAQLEQIERSLAKKRQIGKWYDCLLQDCDALQLPVKSTSYAENIYWVFAVVLRESVPFDAREAIAKLRAVGIGSRHFFWPMHEQPVFRKMGLFDGESCRNAERIARRGFYLPSGLGLTKEDVEVAAKAVKQIVA